ncbi:uncharacterized protein PV06_04363 [Exophiala oligosperma]|uniref:HAD hydrolase, family IA n=1 Tax=Exophiala oligosperma TaxID=215243 RepID=A0A0D2DLD8_9EURO|nr:uncharacterized protein PV06_04363 [Exophiala oligosperma]KIW43240.1 hypothetical protein PV06_04363 [Exophiala oligosperma]
MTPPLLGSGSTPQPVRACIFDLDGLLINSETLLTEARNSTLAEYSRPSMSGTVKASLQGRSAQESTRILYESANFSSSTKVEEARTTTTTTTPTPTMEEFQSRLDRRLREVFGTTRLMPGAEKLLRNLTRATTTTTSVVGDKGGSSGGTGSERKKNRVELALATSSQSAMYRLKTDRLSGPDGVLSLIPQGHKVLGDDERLKRGRGKPFPDIFLLALEVVNETVRKKENEREIKPAECLVFEDAVAGVEAARRAGMRVVWVPEKWLRDMYVGREGEVFSSAGRSAGEGEMGMDGAEAGESGWGEVLSSLEDVDYEKYGIVVGDEQ